LKRHTQPVQPNRSQNRMDRRTRLSVIAVRIFLGAANATMPAILACTLYTDTINDSTGKGVLGGVGMSKVDRNTDLYTVRLKEQKERLPGDMSLSVVAGSACDSSGEQITIGARINPFTQ